MSEGNPTITPSMTGIQQAKRKVKNCALRFFDMSGFASLIGRIYGGRGVILMFHEFTREPKALLGQGCRASDFEAALRTIVSQGRDIVTLSEALIRLKDPQSQPFAVLTFDDGYRSNLELALPIMEKFHAPATIFVPTEMMTRSINAWWLGVRQMFIDNDRVSFDPMGVTFEVTDVASKTAALMQVVAWVWDDFRRVEQLGSVFASTNVSLPDIVDELAITEEEMINIDQNPLIEIGAHTTTHRALSYLTDDEVMSDIGDNKAYLEEKLQRQVKHFAYPYGAPSISGTREALIAKKLGFETAMTTEAGCLFPDHLMDPFLLPRQDGENTEEGNAQVACGANGVFRAIASKFGSPIVNARPFS
ncbi:polysaccharide deacetylase family protein [Labrenzia sp. CE80]|uniref:polysaccharide deacetylase family protein n=1 Tax=Labrenzia sp. CE80 TaxID=1788986 RepID=UPI001931127C|nr:polysaccharide deacetylase family protein [Labrenzia sp. CE80]